MIHAYVRLAILIREVNFDGSIAQSCSAGSIQYTRRLWLFEAELVTISLSPVDHDVSVRKELNLWIKKLLDGKRVDDIIKRILNSFEAKRHLDLNDINRRFLLIYYSQMKKRVVYTKGWRRGQRNDVSFERNECTCLIEEV